MSNFKKLEVVGSTLEEAMSKVTEYFNLNEKNGLVKGDATQAWKNWAKANGESEASRREFMTSYLEKKKAIPGEAYRITISPAVADSRQRPYKIDDCKHEGTRDSNKVFLIYDNANNQVIGKVSTTVDKEGNKHRPTKTDAKNAVKKLILEGFHGKGRVELAKEVDDPVVCTFAYTPSSNTKVGTWLVFGLTKED